MIYIGIILWDGMSPVENIPPNEFLLFVKEQLQSEACYIIYIDGKYSGIRDTSKTAEEWQDIIYSEINNVPLLKDSKQAAMNRIQEQYRYLVTAGYMHEMTIDEYPYDDNKKKKTLVKRKMPFWFDESTLEKLKRARDEAKSIGFPFAPFEDNRQVPRPFCFDALLTIPETEPERTMSEADELIVILNTLAMAFKNRLNQLVGWVNRATTREEYESISWTAEMPDDLRQIHILHISKYQISVEQVDQYIAFHMSEPKKE